MDYQGSGSAKAKFNDAPTGPTYHRVFEADKLLSEVASMATDIANRLCGEVPTNRELQAVENGGSGVFGEVASAGGRILANADAIRRELARISNRI